MIITVVDLSIVSYVRVKIFERFNDLIFIFLTVVRELRTV